MNKKITALLAALLVAFGLFLPRLSALAADRMIRGKVAWEEVRPIDPEVGGGAWQTLSLREKLSLIRHGGQMVSVSDGIMRSTGEEIWQAFTQTMTDFADLGLLPRTEDTAARKVVPFLIFDSMDGERCDLFWQVSANLPCGYDNLEITCLMDDESRNILLIYYTSCTRNFLSFPDRDLEQFSAAYFDRLGLEARILDNPSGDYIAYALDSPVPEEYPVHIDFYATASSLEMHIY